MLDDFAGARKPRTKKMCESAEFLVRLHANEHLFGRLIGRYLIPWIKDAPSGLSDGTITGSARLEFLDLPLRSLEGAWEWSFIKRLLCFMPKPGPAGYALATSVCFFWLLSLLEVVELKRVYWGTEEGRLHH
jgi:FAD dependent monooxygenase